jgi:hypothetical protein
LAGLLYEGAASATVPAPLAISTVKAAVLIAAGQAAVATPAAVLMNEVLKAMLMTKLKFEVAGVMVMVTLGASIRAHTDFLSEQLLAPTTVLKITAADPTQAVEAALKAFREASENEAKRRAAEQLEGALRKYRQQFQATGKGQPQKQ